MKIYTQSELDALMFSAGNATHIDHEGQLVIYTNVYEWEDGTFRSEIDPEVYKDDM